MERSNSSSHVPPSRLTTDRRQLNDELSEVSLSATNAPAASSSSPSASTSTPASTSAQAPSLNGDQSHLQQTPPTASQSEAAPTTTLWENFMASLRNVVHRNPSEATSAASSGANQSSAPHQAPDVNAREQVRTQPATSSSGSGETAEPSAAPSQGLGAQSLDTDANTNGTPRPPVFFRLPFNGPDSNPALLAFHPQPLPDREPGLQSSQQPNTQNQAGTQHPLGHQAGAARTDIHPAGQPRANANAAPTSTHSHPHPEGHVPISPLFVPFGASPLPFSFIYDASTQTAWPIAQVTPGSPPGGPSPDAPDLQQPRLVAGPPFRIILDIHFAAPPEPEQPDPEKAAKYVKQLERADAELRARMARLGMGSIGGFAAASGGDDQDALLGCGVCLDNYEAEDRPEWIDGPRSQDEAVVAVPCSGHHTLHAGCLRDWLVKLPPSQWTCPFCRASLNPDSTHRTIEDSSRSSSKAASSSTAPVHTTLREEVRARERQRGWRCDAPACLPRYPVVAKADDGHLDLPETSDDMTTDLVKLTPCRHEVHLDCLCTSMRVENDLAGANDLDAFMGSDDDTSSDVAEQDESQSAGADFGHEGRNTVGKWVTCPTCRKECWAELPLRRRPHRSAPDAPARCDTDTEPVKASFRDDVEPVSASVMHETDPDSKALHASRTTGQDHISDVHVSGTAEASADPDEEAPVDASLVSS